MSIVIICGKKTNRTDDCSRARTFRRNGRAETPYNSALRRNKQERWWNKKEALQLCERRRCYSTEEKTNKIKNYDERRRTFSKSVEEWDLIISGEWVKKNN